MSEDHQINRRLTRIEDQIDAILKQLPSEKKEKSGITKWLQDIVTLIAAILAAIAGAGFIFYAVGFIIVNMHLAQFGVREFQLTNLAYLPAGLSFFTIGLILPVIAIVTGIGYMSGAPVRTRKFMWRLILMKLQGKSGSADR